jgi:peptide deformylase
MIIVDNEEALRVHCEDVKENEIGHIIDLLDIELSYSEKMGRPGIGLAAPQIGLGKRIAIVRYDKYKINLVNCKISHQYDLEMFKEEGCLSFPNRVENTMRYQEIHVVDNLVYPYSFILTGLLAVIVQHELDHLNSILLPDRAIKEEKTKIGNNDPCFCGSNKKFKKCHKLLEIKNG